MLFVHLVAPLPRIYEPYYRLFAQRREGTPSEVVPIFVPHQTSPVVRCGGADESCLSRGRGRPCSPSREEFAHGQEQAREREYDEHDLVDVLFAGRQSAYQVRRPEDRVIP
jgi:hypothetical protein